MAFINEKVKFSRLKSGAIVPKYASASAAGADLYACMGEDIVVSPGETVKISTGLAVAIPDGYAGLVYARSGLATKKGLAPANKVGVIDSDYRGEVMVMLHNHSSEPALIEDGDRIAQLVITPVIQAIFEEAETLDDTERGTGGFGSTGLK